MATLAPEVLANIAARRLNIQNQRDTALQRLGQNYGESNYNLDQFAKDSGRRIDDQMASQGIFNSGMRVDQQGRLQTNVGEKRGFLAGQYANSQRDVQNQYDAGQQNLNDYQNQAMGQATQSELQQRMIDAQNQAAMQAAQAAEKQANDQRWYQAMSQNENAARDRWFAAMSNQPVAPQVDPGPSIEDIMRWVAAMSQPEQPLQTYRGASGGARFM
jgi:hypothetical protein